MCFSYYYMQKGLDVTKCSTQKIGLTKQEKTTILTKIKRFVSHISSEERYIMIAIEDFDKVEICGGNGEYTF